MNITKPTLLLDLQKCRTNIKKMAVKAAKNNLIFRPHFKTHQSIDIGKIIQEFGINKITVSSVEMAKYFADAGWKDITIAFPVNLLELEEIEKLSEEVILNILISSFETAKKLTERTTSNLNFFVEIDAGYHRSGIDVNHIDEINKTILLLIENHKFKGFLTHAGNTYHAKSKQEILKIHENTTEKMKVLKTQFIDRFPNLKLSIGDTPSCTLAENFDEIDEIRPGNFVFYDLMQFNLGVCKFEEIAVCVACPVVDINRDRNQIVIYGGGVHLSKEFIMQNGEKNFGEVELLNESGWQKQIISSNLISLSQEHGIIQASDELLDEVTIGDVVGIIPIHSCMTASLLGSYKSLNNRSLDHMQSQY